MSESSVTERRRPWVEVAFLALCFASRPVLADPVPSTHGSSAPAMAVQEDAVLLHCSDRAYSLLILPDGSALLRTGQDQQPLQLFAALNPAKTDLECDDTGFSIRTGQPFSNRLMEQHFVLENGQARLASRREYDPTEELLEKARQMVFRGNRAGLKALSFSDIEYAYQYVNADRIHRLLNESMQRCDTQNCRQLIENTFLLITRLSNAVAGTERNPERPTQWILALDDLAVPVADSAPLLLRYSEILKRQNQETEALKIVQELLRRDTQSPEIRLIYGDLLWERGQKDEARQQYRAFADLIARDGKTPPARIARLLEDR